MRVIDFHIHVALKDHYNESISNFLSEVRSEYHQRYDDLADPVRFADYLRSQQIEKAVILADYSPITCGIVPNEFTLEYCQDVEAFIPFVALNPYLTANPAKEFTGTSVPSISPEPNLSAKCSIGFFTAMYHWSERYGSIGTWLR